MHNAFESLLSTFDETLAEFDQSEPVRRLLSGRLTVHHYASILREIYFYTRDNPQLQAAWTQQFSGSRRGAVRRVLGHAMDEIGHDQMAISDLEALGYDTGELEYSDMLPSTLPIVAVPAYESARGRGIGYLGQIFFLEFTPTRSGASYLDALRRAGVPESAMSFLAEHVAVDVRHNRMMKRHVSDLVLTEEDLDLCRTSIRRTGYFYAAMLAGALRAADTGDLCGLTRKGVGCA